MSLGALPDRDLAEKMAQAVEEQDADNIRFYRRNGASPNARDSAGLTLLQNAVNDGKLRSAAALLEVGATVDLAGGPSHWTALHYAAYRINRDMTALLLKSGADPNIATPAGERPLHTAAHAGDLDVVIALVKAGADMSAKNERGQTAAEIATRRAEERLQFAQKPFVEIAVYLQTEMKAAELRADMRAALQDVLARDIAKLKSLHPERYRVKPRLG